MASLSPASCSLGPGESLEKVRENGASCAQKEKNESERSLSRREKESKVKKEEMQASLAAKREESSSLFVFVDLLSFPFSSSRKISSPPPRRRRARERQITSKSKLWLVSLRFYACL